jgi:hypothetical protein
MFFEEISKVLSLAKEQSVTLRLIGATAIRSRSETAKKLAAERPITDLDFVGYKKERKKIADLFGRLGYQGSEAFNLAHGDERLLYFGLEGKLKIDVWLEIFRMAHTFNFKDRLEVDYPTLPLADLVMTKLQIVELNEKDVRDLICLLTDHGLSEDDRDREKINVTRIADECKQQWGVYKTFTTNLSFIKQMTPKYAMDSAVAQRVQEQIDQILKAIEAAPKTFGWKMRAKIGESRPWYETPDVR